MKNMKNTILQDQDMALRARALSAAWLYPDAQWRGRFGRVLADAISRLEGAGGAREAEGLRRLKAALDETSAEGLEEEHVRLFGSAAAASFDLVYYLSESPFEQARRAADLGGFYAAFGVAVKEGERPDSLPVALELLGYLWFKAGYAREKGWSERQAVASDAADALVRDFLSPALAGFSARLGEKTGNPFYLQLAGLSREALDDARA